MYVVDINTQTVSDTNAAVVKTKGNTNINLLSLDIQRHHKYPAAGSLELLPILEITILTAELTPAVGHGRTSL
jgi:hypothetical protein